MAVGKFTSGEVFLSEKITMRFYSWQIGLQILVKYSSRFRSESRI